MSAWPEFAANTVSTLYYPPGVGTELLGEIANRGVVVAEGLHPAIRGRYFRVGHMGVNVHRPEALVRAVRAIAQALDTCGAEPIDVGAVVDVTRRRLAS